MFEVHGTHGMGDAFWFGSVHWERPSCFHITKGAAAGAGVAHDEEGGGASPPTFTDVGTAGSFANGVQSLTTHEPLEEMVVVVGVVNLANFDPGRPS